MLKEYIRTNFASIVIAVILAAFTVWAIRYIIRSFTSTRESGKGQNEDNDKPKGKKGDWGCELNNIMGYDFIQIQHINSRTAEEKKEQQDGAASPAETPKENIAAATRMGTTGRDAYVKDDTPPETPAPENTERTVPLGKRRTDRKTDKLPDKEPVIEDGGTLVSSDTMDLLSRLDAGELDDFFNTQFEYENELMEQFNKDIQPDEEDRANAREISEIPDVMPNEPDYTSQEDEAYEKLKSLLAPPTPEEEAKEEEIREKLRKINEE